jgi:hypothetical protein
VGLPASNTLNEQISLRKTALDLKQLECYDATDDVPSILESNPCPMIATSRMHSGSGGNIWMKKQSQIVPRMTRGKIPKESRLQLIWEGLSRAGLGEAVLRFGTHLLSIALVLVVVWAMRAFYLRAQEENRPEKAVFAAELPTPVPPTDRLPACPFQ